MTIRQLRLKHARALRERLAHGPKSGSHGKSLTHSKKWHDLLSEPLISHNKKI